MASALFMDAANGAAVSTLVLASASALTSLIRAVFTGPSRQSPIQWAPHRRGRRHWQHGRCAVLCWIPVHRVSLHLARTTVGHASDTWLSR